MNTPQTKTLAAVDQPRLVLRLIDTRIDTAGVMRCCLATVAEEYEGQDVQLGFTSRCRYCKAPFTLVQSQPYPLWTPDRFIPQNAIAEGRAESATSPNPPL